MKLGPDRITAKTDGGLQILIAMKDEQGNELEDEVIWERSFYELALEVAKTLFKTLTYNSRKDSIHVVKTLLQNLMKVQRQRLYFPVKYSLKCLLASIILNSIHAIRKYFPFSSLH